MASRPNTRPNEAERWRGQAEVALKKFSRAMDFFLFATSQLIKLSTVHAPDDYNHCACCKTPWPCESMQIIRRISTEWSKTQDDTN